LTTLQGIVKNYAAGPKKPFGRQRAFGRKIAFECTAAWTMHVWLYLGTEYNHNNSNEDNKHAEKEKRLTHEKA